MFFIVLNYYIAILLLFYFLSVFHTSARWLAFTGVWVTLLSILAYLNNAVVWIGSARPSIFNSSNSPTTLTNLWRPFQERQLQLVLPLLSYSTVLSGKVLVLVFLFAVFAFHSVVHWDGKVHKTVGSLYFFISLIITRSGYLSEIKGSIHISKSQRILWVSFSSADSVLCIYHLIVWWKFNLRHNSQWITFTPSPVVSSFIFPLC